ncbi:MAG: ribose-phosphate pyrophosphokinase [Deltaproteobacteria bacterium]|jgi:ribose-phosphate pyrophosphokinase|nr:ribose-phosphate pyrophosphokinase [Deltaproteobacteria bacterium]MBW1958866.1 ribose-phosphate pyrophosphokinase [Deltaproteobacteria bacterium]MBW2012880.1 ribose-phosphate pyrophosphokinase [Deltaproteobacteria bacterium]MBW2088338.1 ribose-phosphate pyrophosphokinase [Deltaproteobacteria bacterium]MBW2321464.1 ribose-phosphate pyrophosphokinase [Deltaproteobacteria bacterium]
MNDFVIFSGNSNPALSRKICEYIQVPLGGEKVKRFSDGEIQIEIDENVRSKDVFVIQSICFPVNENLVELLLMLDALKRASANRISAVIPYYGYARQDKKVAPRVPISAKLVADILTVAGATRIITMDLHAGQIQGFFNIPVDNLFAAPVIIDYIRKKFNNDLVIVSPDAGGVERARAFAKRLNAGLAIIDKRREAPNQAKAMAVIGDVTDKIVVILDDMVDTAGTLVEAAGAIMKNGAREIHASCSHAVLSGPAIERIENSDLKTLVVTDTIPLNKSAKACNKIKVLSISELIGEAIIRSFKGDSVTSLFV